MLQIIELFNGQANKLIYSMKLNFHTF